MKKLKKLLNNDIVKVSLFAIFVIVSGIFMVWGNAKYRKYLTSHECHIGEFIVIGNDTVRIVDWDQGGCPPFEKGYVLSNGTKINDEEYAKTIKLDSYWNGNDNR